jgi:hypothetical protein
LKLQGEFMGMKNLTGFTEGVIMHPGTVRRGRTLPFDPPHYFLHLRAHIDDTSVVGHEGEQQLRQESWCQYVGLPGNLKAIDRLTPCSVDACIIDKSSQDHGRWVGPLKLFGKLSN